MKHFIRWMLGISVILLLAGLGFVIGALSLGASLKEADFLKEMGNRVLHIQDFSRIESFMTGEEELELEHLSEILQEEEEEVYEEYEGKLRREHATHHREGSTYEVGAVKNLEIDLPAGDLYMEAYDGEEISVSVSLEDRESVKVSSGEDFLRVEGLKKIHFGAVEILYPKNLKLDQLKIHVDAGTVDMADDIHADYLEIEIGAGELDTDGNLYTETSMVKVGAGNISIDWISAKTLDGNCGVGAMQLFLEGREKEYDYYLECGLGEIRIGENIHSSIADHEEIRNERSSKEIRLSCGLGEIELDFEKK